MRETATTRNGGKQRASSSDVPVQYAGRPYAVHGHDPMHSGHRVVHTTQDHGQEWGRSAAVPGTGARCIYLQMQEQPGCVVLKTSARPSVTIHSVFIAGGALRRMSLSRVSRALSDFRHVVNRRPRTGKPADGFSGIELPRRNSYRMYLDCGIVRRCRRQSPRHTVSSCLRACVCRGH